MTKNNAAYRGVVIDYSESDILAIDVTEICGEPLREDEMSVYTRVTEEFRARFRPGDKIAVVYLFDHGDGDYYLSLMEMRLVFFKVSVPAFLLGSMIGAIVMWGLG